MITATAMTATTPPAMAPKETPPSAPESKIIIAKLAFIQKQTVISFTVIPTIPLET